MTLQDERTIEQMKEDYRYGKEIEEKVIKYLKTLGTVKVTNSQDKRLNPGKYTPDCVLINGVFGYMPLEIKCPRVKVPNVHWKVNQYNKARKIGGYLLVISDKRWCLTSSDEEGELLQKGYCHKPVYVFTNLYWYPTKDLYKLFKQSN